MYRINRLSFGADSLSWRFVLLLIFLFSACGDSDTDLPQIQISSDFESGSIGRVERRGPGNWDLYLKDDNDNSELPDRYRNWWYVRLDNVTPGRSILLTIRNRGWWYYYVPVYSYDRLTWYRFEEGEVRNGSACSDGFEDCVLQISTRFSQNSVYVARFYPYTTQDLDRYLRSIEASPFVTVKSLGKSSDYGLDIAFAQVEDPTVADEGKRAVWIHARSNPAETGSSFMVEGMIDQLLDDLSSGHSEAKDVVFYVAPMHNVDGVVEGNYRTDTLSRNLEIEWRPDDAQTLYISEASALENRMLNAEMVRIIQNPAYRDDLIALNLHSSNSDPDTPAFAYPHFGDDPTVYLPEEISLWRKHLRLLSLLTDEYDGRFSPPPAAGGRGFLNYPFPETWWWRNMQDDGVAITIETVYGKAGFDHWVTPDDIRDLGASLTSAIYDYYLTDLARQRDRRLREAQVGERVEPPDEIGNKL